MGRIATLAYYDRYSIAKAVIAFYALWLIVTLVQLGQTAKIVSNPANASRRGIFRSLLVGTICMAISYGIHIGRTVCDSIDGTFSSRSFITFYIVDLVFNLGGLVLAYISVFLAIYHRAEIYVGSSARLWFVKKIICGITIGLWTLLYVIEMGSFITAREAYYTDSETTEYDSATTMRSLDVASRTFFILVHIVAMVDIFMLNNARRSQRAQDPVVRTLMRGMLPILVFRTIWNMIVLILSYLEGAIEAFEQIENVSLADEIIEPFSLSIMVGIMIRLGFQTAFWDITAGVTPHPGPVTPVQQPQSAHGGQQMVGGQQGRTVVGPNGQVVFVPSPSPGQGPDAAWKHDSTSPPTPILMNNTDNHLPTYQQQNLLPYNQSVPRQQHQQQEFAHLPQPSGENVHGRLGAPRPPMDPYSQPNMNGLPQTHVASNPSANVPPAAAQS